MGFQINEHSMKLIAERLAKLIQTEERRDAERLLVKFGFTIGGAAAIVALHLSKYDIVVGDHLALTESILDEMHWEG